MVNASFLDQFNSELTLVNTARGELIEEESLIDFLRQNPRAFAFLDVFDPEPFSRKRFRNLDNVASTCHIAGVYRDIGREVLLFEYRVVKDFIDSPREFSRSYPYLLGPQNILDK